MNPSPMPARRQVSGFVFWVLVCFVVAGLGGLVTASRIPNWYAELAKPAWTPPGWIFGPIWTLLYFLMAVAAWLVWRQAGASGARLPLGLFALQLALNCLWSVLFFGLQAPGAAAVEIVVLWTAIALTLLAFWRRSQWAGLLLSPYLLWVTFAAALNFAIWRMNA
jgi:translocator protein